MVVRGNLPEGANTAKAVEVLDDEGGGAVAGRADAGRGAAGATACDQDVDLGQDGQIPSAESDGAEVAVGEAFVAQRFAHRFVELVSGGVGETHLAGSGPLASISGGGFAEAPAELDGSQRMQQGAGGVAAGVKARTGHVEAADGRAARVKIEFAGAGPAADMAAAADDGVGIDAGDPVGGPDLFTMPGAVAHLFLGGGEGRGRRALHWQVGDVLEGLEGDLLAVVLAAQRQDQGRAEGTADAAIVVRCAVADDDPPTGERRRPRPGFGPGQPGHERPRRGIDDDLGADGDQPRAGAEDQAGELARGVAQHIDR